jgi:Zn-finger nucleic acid-binding protein
MKMKQVRAGEVTVDVCKDCDAFWIDMEEIRAYVEATDPDAEFIPTDDEFKEHTSNLEEECACCGIMSLERGVAGRSEFRRCTWCGGIFIFKADLDRFRARWSGRTTKRPGLDALRQIAGDCRCLARADGEVALILGSNPFS